MSDVLFVKTSSLGDVIHHMPALSDARARRPSFRFSWVVEESFAPLVRLHPAIDEVIPVASRRWRRAPVGASTWREVGGFWRGLRARNYDAIIDTQGLVRSALIARAAHGRRHGYDADSIRERAASLFYDVRHSVARDQHAITRNRRLTGLALGYSPEGPPDYGLDRAKLARPSPDRYALLLHATAEPDKEWPAELWIALGQSLRARNLRLVLPWGTAREQERSRAIAAALPDAGVPDLQPLDAVARLIAGAALVVGVDTGLLHLAGALGVPLVGIFVGSEPGLTGPLGQGPIAVVGGKGERPDATAAIAAVDRIAS
ncbi:MAG: lipopolysaccharide heptosyltransferase I [Xanthobacteraceae bacterium]|nr:lipopolysaccharide heptosyltransferase I [Xanthobacteraceae bacterium]